MLQSRAVRKLVWFAARRSQVQILPPQPTMRTQKDIGAKNPETVAVPGVLYKFNVELKRCRFLKRTFEMELNYRTINIKGRMNS